MGGNGILRDSYNLCILYSCDSIYREIKGCDTGIDIDIDICIDLDENNKYKMSKYLDFLKILVVQQGSLKLFHQQYLIQILYMNCHLLQAQE